MIRKLVTRWKDLFGAPPEHAVEGVRYSYWKGAAGWCWNLKAANNEIIAQGEGYSSKANVLRGIETVRIAAATDKVVGVDPLAP